MWAAERERERVKYETWVGAWGSLQRCLLFWFVSFWFCFNVFVCLFVFLLRGHWQFTNTLVFPGVQRSRRKAATKTMENVGERVGKKCFHFEKQVQQQLKNEFSSRATLQNSGIEQCHLVLLDSVRAAFTSTSWTFLKPVCFLSIWHNVVVFFPLYKYIKKKIKKKT